MADSSQLILSLFLPKGEDTNTNDAVADFLENNLQNFIRDCNAKVVVDCENSEDPGKSLGCFLSKFSDFCLQWPFFTETGKVGSGKNPKSGFFLLGLKSYIMSNQ